MTNAALSVVIAALSATMVGSGVFVGVVGAVWAKTEVAQSDAATKAARDQDVFMKILAIKEC